MLKTFKGGLHVPDHKKETCHIPVRKIDGAPVHIFPLQQHIGARCEPTVKVGDSVTVGQVIADSEAFLSVPIHSSVSGTVKEIKPYVHPSGNEVLSIFIENDFEYKPCETAVQIRREGMTKQDIVHAIRMGGIVGMGGAGFPSHVKLSPPEDKLIKYIMKIATKYLLNIRRQRKRHRLCKPLLKCMYGR